jgi:copper chaperone
MTFGCLKRNENIMETKFKTNIKCSACVEKVTPHLDESVGKDKWHVDLTSPNKLLTVESDVPPAVVSESLSKAGYKGEPV